MTLPVAPRKSGPYTGNGTNKSFAYGFKISDEDELKVIMTTVATAVETVLSSSTYTVSGVDNDAGGAVTYPATGSAITSDYTITIIGNTEISQDVDISNSGDFYPSVHEAVFDKLTAICQQQQEELDRCVKLTASSTVDPDDYLTNIQTYTSTASAAASTATAAAAAAGTSETNAAASALAASTSETNAAASALAAQVAEIDWKGNWSAGTYYARDAVAHNGSSWIVKASVASTTQEPSGTATDWDTLALRGNDGTGSGDVSSSVSSSVNNEIVVFDSTTGKLVKRANTISGIAKLSSGVVSAATEGTDYSGGTSALATGILKSTTGTGDLAIAEKGTDYAGVDLAQTYTKAQRGAVTTLSYASTITADFSAANNYTTTLTGNATLGCPTNVVAGQDGAIRVIQDTTGSRTLAYAWCWAFAGGTAPTLSTAAGTRDDLYYSVKLYKTSTVTITIASPGVVSWTAHGLVTGQKVQLTTTGALPTGLTASTTYYVINTGAADTLRLATSLANAVAGTAINTSGSQSGTHTMVASTIAANLVKAVA